MTTYPLGIHNTNAWTPLCTEDYSDLNTLIVGYWGRREIELLASSEESPYRTHSVIVAAARQFHLEDRACIEEGFPKDLVRIFANADLSLWRIPLVEGFTHRELLEGSINLLNGDIVEEWNDAPLEEGIVVSSMCRFITRTGQPGIALSLKGNDTSEEIFTLHGEEYPVKDLYVGVSIKKDNPPRWEDALFSDWRVYTTVINRQDNRGTRYYPDAERNYSYPPPLGISENPFECVSRFILNKHPSLKLATEPVQIRRPIPMQIEQVFLAEQNSFWTQFVSCINKIVQYVLDFFRQFKFIYDFYAEPLHEKN